MLLDVFSCDFSQSSASKIILFQQVQAAPFISLKNAAHYHPSITSKSLALLYIPLNLISATS